ncbi:MAG: GDSL-type esterase/lipase family protein [Candidatus Ornithomonoglobus sp.]
MSKWTASWGTATSITERREGNYAKDITLRYSMKCTLDGSRIRVRFSNICGTEPVKITEAYTSVYKGDGKIDAATSVAVTFNGASEGIIPAGEEITSDEIDFITARGTDMAVSMYFGEMTQMMSSVYVEGPCSEFFFSNGNLAKAAELPIDNRMPSGNCHFLNTIEVLSDDDARAVVLFGDSITAQSWPDRLNLHLLNTDKKIAAIRRGVSGTRMLGQYDCLQYAHYGLSGKNRFVRECNAAGADSVIIFHGINDIIHPDGINPFRPMSNFPTLEEMADGFRYYIREAHKMGLKAYLTTILPIEGWRTYEVWREELREKVNEWIRTTDEADGVIDFDAAIRNPANPRALAPEFDSSDHLHPSGDGAQILADTAFEFILKNNL